MMWCGYGWGWGLNWLWILLVLLGAALLVFVIVQLVTRGARAGTDAARPESVGAPSARQILEERYARGQIDTEEFTERRRRLDEA